MKDYRPIEPGILPVFRLFTGLRLGLTVLLVAVQFIINPTETPTVTLLVVLSLLDPALLFTYLSYPVLQEKLKGFYLPIAVVWAAAGPILSQQMSIQLSLGSIPENRVPLLGLQLIPILFIPLIVVGWQYSFRAVVAFAVLVELIGFVPLLFLATLSGVLPPLIASFVVQTATFLLVGNMVASLMKVQRAQRKELTEANQRLAHYAAALEQLTISRERNRMARELHDVLAHTLSGVAVELEGTRALLHSDTPRAGELLNHSLEAVREGLSETRRALKELRARPLEDLGLGLALRALAESTSGRAGFGLELDIAEEVAGVEDTIQQCIYRTAQEALVNAADHAQASLVRVSLVRRGSRLVLEVADNGCGFDLSAPPEEFQYGLRGMYERAEMAGGELQVESRPGEGTRVVLSIGAPDLALIDPIKARPG